MRVGIVRVAVCVLAGLVFTNAANASGSYGGAAGFTPPKLKKAPKSDDASEPKKTKKKKTSELGVRGAYSWKS